MKHPHNALDCCPLWIVGIGAGGTIGLRTGIDVSMLDATAKVSLGPYAVLKVIILYHYFANEFMYCVPLMVIPVNWLMHYD